VHAAIPPGASILEFGCGGGRMTHELVRLAALEGAGLVFDGWLDDRHTWLAARRAA